MKDDTRKVPKQIAIEITSRCQLRCVGCMKTIGYNNADMEYEYIKSIIDRNTFGATIIPYMNGEPLLHPDIYKITKYVIDKNMRMYITTNGMIWNQELFELITQKNSCYQLLISLDGLPSSKSRSIETARPGSNRKVILDNIRKLIELKNKNGNNIDLCLKLCQRGQDWQEMEDYVYYWLNEGVDYICIGRMLNQEGSPMRLYSCQYFSDMYMLIRADHEIVPCMYNYDVAIDNCFELGKLDDKESLIDAYNRPAFAKLREDQQNGIFHKACVSCNSAYTGYGFRGQLEFNKPEYKKIGKMFTTIDYYNQTFSLVDKAVGVQYNNVRQ